MTFRFQSNVDILHDEEMREKKRAMAGLCICRSEGGNRLLRSSENNGILRPRYRFCNNKVGIIGVTLVICFRGLRKQGAREAHERTNLDRD
jgi:hypothetical protein